MLVLYLLFTLQFCYACDYGFFQSYLVFLVSAKDLDDSETVDNGPCVDSIHDVRTDQRHRPRPRQGRNR